MAVWQLISREQRVSLSENQTHFTEPMCYSLTRVEEKSPSCYSFPCHNRRQMSWFYLPSLLCKASGGVELWYNGSFIRFRCLLWHLRSTRPHILFLVSASSFEIVFKIDVVDTTFLKCVLILLLQIFSALLSFLLLSSSSLLHSLSKRRCNWKVGDDWVIATLQHTRITFY